MRKNKKILSLCLFVLMIITSITVFANRDIRVMLNGEYLEFDVEPQLINNRTMVPLRAIFETLGAEVEWNGDTQTVTAFKDDIEVVATIGSTTMYVDDEAKTVDVAPIIVDGRTLVPARFVAEAFDCDVDWVEEENIVCIEQYDMTSLPKVGLYVWSDNETEAGFEISKIINSTITFSMTLVNHDEDVVFIEATVVLDKNGYGTFSNIEDNYGNKNSGYVRYDNNTVIFKVTKSNNLSSAKYGFADIEYILMYV